METYEATLARLREAWSGAAAYCRRNWKQLIAVGVLCGVVLALVFVRDTVTSGAKRLLTQTVLQEQTTVEVPATTLEERFAELSTKVSSLESSLKQSASQTSLLRETFEHALAEVAAQNDQLVAQAEKLTAALAKVPGLASATSSTSKPAQPTKDTSGKVNINTATPQQLDTLPGIGPSYAERIVAYRTEHGNFLSTEDIQNVPGIGPATYAKIEALISV